MAITSERKVRLGARAVRVFVETDSPSGVLYWYRNGGLAAVGKLPFFDVVAGPGEAVSYWVTDDETAVPPVSYPARARFEWENVPGAVKYWVVQFIDGDFGAVAQVEAGRQGSTFFVTSLLQDDTLHYFAVLPVTAAGNEGSLRVMTVFMVRPPAVVTAEITYDGGVLSSA